LQHTKEQGLTIQWCTWQWWRFQWQWSCATSCGHLSNSWALVIITSAKEV